MKKERKPKVVKNELGFKDGLQCIALGMYRNAKKCAEDITKFARELSSQQGTGVEPGNGVCPCAIPANL
jgi:hypothetical protein